jgi:hypothetical protein
MPVEGFIARAGCVRAVVRLFLACHANRRTLSPESFIFCCLPGRRTLPLWYNEQ